jgi:hypothetical protein
MANLSIEMPGDLVPILQGIAAAQHQSINN